jgi:beta-galactosidase/beta-glucuronidase
LAPLGLYGNARLYRAPDVLIDAVTVQQRHAEGRVTVEVEIALDPASSATMPYVVGLGEQMCGGAVDLSRDRHIRVAFDIENPELWWPPGWVRRRCTNSWSASAGWRNAGASGCEAWN